MKNKKKIIKKQDELIAIYKELSELQAEPKKSGVNGVFQAAAIGACIVSTSRVNSELEVLKAANEDPFKDVVFDDTTKFERCNDPVYSEMFKTKEEPNPFKGYGITLPLNKRVKVKFDNSGKTITITQID